MFIIFYADLIVVDFLIETVCQRCIFRAFLMLKKKIPLAMLISAKSKQNFIFYENLKFAFAFTAYFPWKFVLFLFCHNLRTNVSLIFFFNLATLQDTK